MLHCGKEMLNDRLDAGEFFGVGDDRAFVAKTTLRTIYTTGS
jgi:hypothetical protein